MNEKKSKQGMVEKKKRKLISGKRMSVFESNVKQKKSENGRKD